MPLRHSVTVIDNNVAMAAWSGIERGAADFARRVRERFDAGTNKTLATLRRNGAPRISASEMEFSSDGEVTLGMMAGSMKLFDVLRDPRVALHSPILEPPKDDPELSGRGRQDERLAGGHRATGRHPVRGGQVLQVGHHGGCLDLRRDARRPLGDRVVAPRSRLGAANENLTPDRLSLPTGNLHVAR